jgi:tRNA pseudouridine32 synthase/23S rRNA pseudouridine746 synthase
MSRMGASPDEISAVSPTSMLTPSPDDSSVWQCAWVTSSAYTHQPEAVSVLGELRVVHCDDDIVVVEKPAYLPTENTATIKESVRSQVEARLGMLQTERPAEALAQQEARAGAEAGAGRLHLPHRLDWETSGLLVLARNSAAMRSLSDQFATRSVRKSYLADVVGAPPAARGTCNLPLSPDPQRRPLQRVDFGRSGKPSRTRWSTEAELPHACRLLLEPESGRRHQLRMHCLGLGCAIGGDGLYEQTQSSARAALERAAAGGSAPPPPRRLHLHAAELSFTHPTSGASMNFRSEPPFALGDVARWAAEL